jgi:hypothetical protein
MRLHKMFLGVALLATALVGCKCCCQHEPPPCCRAPAVIVAPPTLPPASAYPAGPPAVPLVAPTGRSAWQP